MQFVPAIFKSPAILSVLEIVKRIAPSSAPVLLFGETGSGKEVIAEHLHRTSKRADKIFQPVNCSTIPKEQAEAELFGAVKGAYTGSIIDRPGLFKSAHTGTLLLDELLSMSLEIQAKILRAVEDKQIRPLGGYLPFLTDVRIMATINQEPELAISQGLLREDLFYRLNTITLKIPPLRERTEDILPLAEFFLRDYCEALNRPVMNIADNAQEILLSYHWPGNVRQLKNQIHHITLLYPENTITADMFSFISKPINKSKTKPC